LILNHYHDEHLHLGPSKRLMTRQDGRQKCAVWRKVPPPTHIGEVNLLITIG